MDSRIRIENTGKYSSINGYQAIEIKTNRIGSIDKYYIPLKKQKEVENIGFAYINQPKERIV